MQAKSAKESIMRNKPQHLVTNIEYKLKPHRRRTKFLRAKIDTCSNVNLIPISVYKLIYNDQDCTKLEPSNKAAVKTYIIEKTKIVGSCKMFVVHPDTKLLQEVIFQVTSHEDSVTVSCATSIELGLIHPHKNLDEIPEEGSLIYSIADMPRKQKNKNCQAKNVNMWPLKPQTDMRLEKNIPLHKEKKYEYDEFRSQSTKEDKLLYYDKKCQETKRSKKPKSVMQSVTNTEDRWPAKHEIRRLCKDKNCQSTRCYKNMSPRRPMQNK